MNTKTQSRKALRYSYVLTPKLADGLKEAFQPKAYPFILEEEISADYRKLKNSRNESAESRSRNSHFWYAELSENENIVCENVDEEGSDRRV